MNIAWTRRLHSQGYMRIQLRFCDHRVRQEGRLLHFDAGFLTRSFSFIQGNRDIVIDLESGLLLVPCRKGWLRMQERVVPRDQLSHLDYSYHPIVGDRRRVDSFAIRLVTHSGDSHALCRFTGPDGLNMRWPGCAASFGDTAEEESRGFVTRLSGEWGIPLGNDFGLSALMCVCESCGRKISGKKTYCLYSGALPASQA